MAEPIGAAASVITLVQLAAQLCKLVSKIKGAPHEWRRYCTSLENLGHTHDVIGQVIKTLNLPANLTVELENAPESLVSFCDNRLNTVLQEGKQVLRKFNTAEKPMIKRWFKKFFEDTGKQFQYILTADHIHSLILSVEHEKSCLQLALSVAILAANGQQHQAIQDKINDLIDKMLGKFHELNTVQQDNQFIHNQIPVSMFGHIEPDQNLGLLENSGDMPQAQEDLASTDDPTSDGGSVENENCEATETYENEEALEDDQTHVEHPGEGQKCLELIRVKDRQEDNSLVKVSEVTVSPNAVVELLRNDEDLLFDESDLVRFRDYLASQDETVTSKPFWIQAESIFTNQLVEDLCRSEGSDDYLYKLCIKTIRTDGDENHILFKEPCLRQPCDHVTIHTDVDLDLLDDGDEFILKQSDKLKPSQSEAGQSDTDDEIEIRVFDRCENGCSHTLLIDSSDLDQDVIKCASNGPFHYHFDEILVSQRPISSLPCVFCAKEAKRPILNIANREGWWPFYNKKYEYHCSRCGKTTTVTG